MRRTNPEPVPSALDPLTLIVTTPGSAWAAMAAMEPFSRTVEPGTGTGSGAVPPGDHTLQVVVRLQGHGYGVFSYLRGYKFDVKSSHSFTITEGKTITLDAIAWEKGDVTTPLEQRPNVRFESNVKTGFGGPSTAGAAPAAAAPAVQGSAGASVGTGGK